MASEYDALLDAVRPRSEYDALLSSAETIAPKLSDTFPQERTGLAEPSYVPAELQQFAEQQAIEGIDGKLTEPRWVGDTARAVGGFIPEVSKFAGKVALAAGGAQTGRFYWPTDEEVQTPAIPAKYMPPHMIGEAAERLFPESKIAQGYGGAMKGVGEFMSGLTSPENLATLPITGLGKAGTRLISGAFLGQSIAGTPEQWKAFNEAENLSDKFRIATMMGLGIAAPVAGAAATFKKASVDSVTRARLQSESPKVVEPVRTTQEASTSSQVPAETDVPLPQQPRPIIPAQDQTKGIPERVAQPESISPPVEEARPKTQGVPNAIYENLKRQIPEPIRPDIQREASEAVLRDERISRAAKGEPGAPSLQGAVEKAPEVTSTQNKITAAEREKVGLPEAVQAARRDFGAVWDEAEAVAKTDAEAPRRLVAEISENPRALTDKENALLLRRQIEVRNEHSAAIDEVNSRPGDAAALSRLETARNDLQAVYDATKSAGTETGRGLNARKMLANQDFTLAKMEAETRAVVNEGKPLTPKQANEVRHLHARIAQAEAKVAAYEAREQFNAELRQARRTGFRPDSFLEQQAQKARERIIARRGKLFADPVGVTQIAHLADEAIIGAAHIAKGVRNFSDWSKTMLTEFGERIKPYLQALFQRAQSLHSETSKRAVATPEERLSRALEGDKKRIATNIAKIEAKTAAGDFTKPERPPPRMDKEKANLLFEYQKAKEAYTKGLFQARLSQQSAPRKALRYGGEVLNTMRALMTSFDLSAVLRQGGFVTLGHPLRAAKSLSAMFRAFASEKAQFRINEEIRNRPNAPLYRQSKLYLADESAMSLSKMEEAYMSRWASKIPIVAGSQRAYTTFLNKLRADSFDAMVENLGRRGRVTTQEAQAIANFVNVATGRGNMGGAAQAAVGLNTVFFAPRYVLSRFQLLAGQPLYRGTGRTRMVIAKEYGQMLAGLATVYTLAKSAGAEVESDPRSSDFGKLRFGDTRVDPLFGLAQTSVLLSRLGTGETKNLKGKLLPIRGEKVPYGSGNSADVIARFLRTKLSPAFGSAVDIASGKNVVGERVTPQSAALKMMVPLSFGDIYNAMQDQGVEKGSAFAMLALFGMGVQHYSPRTKVPLRQKTLEEGMAELREGKIKEFLSGK